MRLLIRMAALAPFFLALACAPGDADLEAHNSDVETVGEGESLPPAMRGAMGAGGGPTAGGGARPAGDSPLPPNLSSDP